MFRDLHITNFRGFREFHMEGLGRINLLVGPNNCGKTTVLEALDLLADYPDPALLGLQCLTRGGLVAGEGVNGSSHERLALRHLFHGRQGKADSAFKLQAQTDAGACSLRASLASLSTVAPTKSGQPSGVAGRLVLQFEKSTPIETVTHSIPLTPQAEWHRHELVDRLDEIRDSLRRNFRESDPPTVQDITTGLAKVSLNPDEEFVLQTLRTLEPRIVGITAVPGAPGSFEYGRSGIFVKLTGEHERVPIASLGDGIWHLLGLALLLVHNRGHVVFIDEIDIGLHYTAQVDMWRMVKQAAEQLDVQVFATTHSSDCIRALASLARKDVTTGSDITIQRIEGERAVAYSERDIVLSAERGIEVR